MSDSRPPLRREAAWLAPAVLVAFGIRMGVWARTPVLGDDGIGFLYIAREVARGGWGEAVASPHHPLHPAVLAWAGGAFPEGEPRAAVACALLSALAILPLFGLARAALGRVPAWIAAVCLVVHPHLARDAADLLSENTFLPLFAAALWAGWHAIARVRDGGRGLPWWGMAGLCSALAFLVRQEGLLAPVVLGTFAAGILAMDRLRGTRRMLLGGMVVVACLMFVLVPYWMALSGIHGRSMWSPKKAIDLFWSLDGGGGGSLMLVVADSVRPILAAGIADGEFLDRLLLEGLAEYTHPLLALFGLYGLVHLLAGWQGREGRRAGLFLLTAIAGSVLLGGILLAKAGYIEKRHLHPAGVMLVLAAGTGIAALTGRFRDPRRRRIAAWLLPALVVLVVAGKTTRPHRDGPEKRAPRVVGERLRAVYGSGRTVVTYPRSRGGKRLAYYARWEPVFYDAGGVPEPPEVFLARSPADFVLWDLDRSRHLPYGEEVRAWAADPPAGYESVPIEDPTGALDHLRLFRVRTAE